MLRPRACVYGSQKYAVAQVVGYIKGKSAIHIARAFGGRTRNFTGENFWAREHFASTVGRDEEIIRNYIQTQERDVRVWCNSKVQKGIKCKISPLSSVRIIVQNCF
jgi:putative transposase